MVRRWFAPLLGALVLSFALATPAAAHDALIASDPPDGAELDAAPSEIVLEFTGNILDINPELRITDAEGTEVEVGPAQIEGTFVTWELLEELAGGSYDVVWVVTSSDGHPIDGTFTFTSPAAPEPEPSATETDDAAQGETTEGEGTQGDATQDDAAQDPAPEQTDPELTETPGADATLSPEQVTPPPADDISDNAEAWFFAGLAVTVLVVVGIVVLVRRGRDPNGPPGQH